MKDIKIFPKEKKEKSNNMIVNVVKISQKMKKINWLGIEKNVIKREKHFSVIIRKYFNLEHFDFLLGKL